MSSTSRIEAAAAEWIARRDNDDEWTHQQQCDLDAWLDESAAHRVAFLRLNAAWRRADRLRALRNAGPLIPSVPVPPSLPHRAFTRTFGGSRTAACIVVLAATLLLEGDLHRRASPQLFSTPIGSRESVSLEDGSKLTLNTSTRLRARIDANERVLWLDEGEAYFDIAHDATRPFLVVAGNRLVTVVGTKFSLRLEGDRLKVDVIEGRVQVQSKVSSPTLLSGGETALEDGSSVLVSRLTERQLQAATSWLEGRLVFDQVTLAEVAAQFNRYNRKKLVITDAAAANVQIGGTFESGNVEGFARLVQAGLGLAVEFRDDRILMSSAAR